MLVDCGTCAVRDVACGDCVLTVLWGLPDERVDGWGPADEAGPAVSAGAAVALVPVRLDDDDRRALRALADAGLAPRLRHVADGRQAG